MDRIRTVPVSTLLLSVFLLASLSWLAATPSQGQNHPLRSRDEPVTVDSGVIKNEGAAPVEAWRAVVATADATWIRLQFKTANLGEDPRTGTSSTLRIESLQDGAIQILNARTLRQWRNTSAYFNGNGVEITLIAAPNGRENRIRIESVTAGLPDDGSSPTTSICGPTDDRLPSTDPRQGRGIPVGCTTWLIDDAANCFLTAGHCMTGGSLDVVEFNVPLSDSNGNIQHPGPEDQYPVDETSEQFASGGIGQDWGVFGCFPNSNTGLTPAEAQGSTYILASSPPPVSGQTIRITGYGSMPSPPEWNFAQKTHTGPYTNFSGTTIQYATDTTGGNSGSPVFNENSGLAIGIHTHAGCNSGGGANNGTAIDHPALQNALANPRGVCAVRLNFAYPGGVPNTLPPGVAFPLEVDVTGQNASLEPGTVELFVDTGGGFSSQSMTEVTPSRHQADLPALACGTAVRFYVRAETTAGVGFTDPPGAPASFHGAISSPPMRPVVFVDDFEADQGWTVVSENLTGGAWERGNPLGGGDRQDPPADFDGSGQCFLTENVDGNSDVDGGPTRLTSPPFSLAAGDGIVSYARWLGNDDLDDFLTVEISNDDGASWSLVEQVGNGSGWSENSFVVSGIVAPTSQMRLRFSVSDQPNNSVTEAAIDAVRVEVVDCDPGDEMPDLAVTDLQVDYDPGTPGVQGGPGALAQALDVLVTIRNDGDTSITSAAVDLDVNGGLGPMLSRTLVVTDFDTGPGSQPLFPARSFDIVLSFAAGELDRCGTYELIASHDPAALVSQGVGGPVMGDIAPGNDRIADHPDERGDPDDAFSPDLLELEFGTFTTSIRASSEIIEDPQTEKVKVDLDYVGLGPGMDSHNVMLSVEITGVAGSPIYTDVITRSRNGVPSSGSRSLTLRLDLADLSPPPIPGIDYRVRMILFDIDSGEVCIRSITPNFFRVE